MGGENSSGDVTHYTMAYIKTEHALLVIASRATAASAGHVASGARSKVPAKHTEICHAVLAVTPAQACPPCALVGLVITPTRTPVGVPARRAGTHYGGGSEG